MAAARSWYNPIALIHSVMIRPRFYGAAVAGALALVFLPHGWPHNVRAALAWDIGGLVYLFFALRLMGTAARTGSRRAQQGATKAG